MECCLLTGINVLSDTYMYHEQNHTHIDVRRRDDIWYPVRVLLETLSHNQKYLGEKLRVQADLCRADDESHNPAVQDE